MQKRVLFSKTILKLRLIIFFLTSEFEHIVKIFDEELRFGIPFSEKSEDRRKNLGSQNIVDLPSQNKGHLPGIWATWPEYGPLAPNWLKVT